MTPRNSITRAAALLLSCLIVLSGASQADAQNRRDGGLVKDLLKDLIDSQLRKDQRRRTGGRAGLGPARPPAAMTDEELRRLQRFKPLAASYVNASAKLATGMSDELRHSPSLRPLVAQAIQLNASASALATRLDRNLSAELLSTSLRQMDQEHRQLAFRIGQIQPPPPVCKRNLAELDRIRDQVTALYELSPQVDVRSIDELSGALSVTLDALVEDVSVELRSNSAWRQLLQEGQRIQSQCRSFRFVCSQANDRDGLVREYQAFTNLWSPYADRLESFNNQYLGRQIRRAHELNRQIAQQLLIPIGIDRTRARHLAELIEEELKSLYGYINLNVLATLPNGQALPAIAIDLKLQTHGFCECVTNNEGPAQMRTRWETLHKAWTAFTFQLEPIKNRRIRTLAQEIDGSVLALRDVLGIVPVFDRVQVARLAATVDNLSDQMQSYVERWVQRGSAVRNIRADVREFHELAHHFNDSAIDREPADHLLADCDRVVEVWHKLHPKLARCTTPEAVVLNRLSDEVTVALVQLETLLAQ